MHPTFTHTFPLFLTSSHASMNSFKHTRTHTHTHSCQFAHGGGPLFSVFLLHIVTWLIQWGKKRLVRLSPGPWFFLSGGRRVRGGLIYTAQCRRSSIYVPVERFRNVSYTFPCVLNAPLRSWRSSILLYWVPVRQKCFKHSRDFFAGR